jgi:hypothetical protein
MDFVAGNDCRERHGPLGIKVRSAKQRKGSLLYDQEAILSPSASMKGFGSGFVMAKVSSSAMIRNLSTH